MLHRCSLNWRRLDCCRLHWISLGWSNLNWANWLLSRQCRLDSWIVLLRLPPGLVDATPMLLHCSPVLRRCRDTFRDVLRKCLVTQPRAGGIRSVLVGILGKHQTGRLCGRRAVGDGINATEAFRIRNVFIGITVDATIVVARILISGYKLMQCGGFLIYWDEGRRFNHGGCCGRSGSCSLPLRHIVIAPASRDRHALILGFWPFIWAGGRRLKRNIWHLKNLLLDGSWSRRLLLILCGQRLRFRHG
jgi:hypothetical protein